MPIHPLTPQNEMALYRFQQALGRQVPYYFDVPLDAWRQSLLADRDDDGQPLFAQLHTLLLTGGDARDVRGFIQYGRSAFVFDANGRKSAADSYAVIRTLLFDPGAGDAALLMGAAQAYFDAQGAVERHAFFHYLGMRCYAGQGKLHASQPHVETLLGRYGYAREHENVYFSRPVADEPAQADIRLALDEGGGAVRFLRGTDEVAHGALCFVPRTDICFLRDIAVRPPFRHQGMGTRCMRALLHTLAARGIRRLDTDTIDTNLTAQRYYQRNGFADLGRMRSYRAGHNPANI